MAFLRLYIFLTLLLLNAFFDQPGETNLSFEKARKAFDYLNRIRQHPDSISDDVGVDLSYVEPRHRLVWNDTLAAVAEAKALDMAKRNYFDHQTPEGYGINIQIHLAGYRLPKDWIKDESSNYFESLGAGYRDGIDLINGLIIDEGTPGLEHRRHLLGIDEFWSDCRDIGIGIAENPKSTFKTCASIIIAKHNF
ncbi:CAP domain-containing protein [candidate division KSB1 bacterium]|nr:CAP domain-containing protein [candidate division KSB1 bacterium]